MELPRRAPGAVQMSPRFSALTWSTKALEGTTIGGSSSVLAGNLIGWLTTVPVKCARSPTFLMDVFIPGQR